MQLFWVIQWATIYCAADLSTMAMFHWHPSLHKMPFLTLQEIKWLSMEMERNPKVFLPYQDINSFGVLKIPPGAEAERNHKAVAKAPWKVLGKRPSAELLIKAFLQTKRTQEHINKPRLN